jgi:hypothetical protein
MVASTKKNMKEFSTLRTDIKKRAAVVVALYKKKKRQCQFKDL